MILATADGLDVWVEERIAIWRESVQSGFIKVAEMIRDQIKNEQLSGRLPDDMGLNVITGNLRGSIEDKVSMGPYNIDAKIYNEDAAYWYYHQIGAGHNPKRLEISFEERPEWETAYVTEAEEALMRIVA